MANILANIVARSTLLSALEEKRRQQMKKFLLHRLFFVALLRENAESADVTAYHEQLFQRISKVHLGESPSGILLIYSHCLLHILEILSYESAQAPRSSGKALLSILPPSQTSLVGTHERAFFVAAPRLWNSLPREARLAPSLLFFDWQASSGTLYHILMDLAAVENQDSKLFNQWYATAVEVPVTLEDVTQTQTTEEVITECLTLNLKLGVYLATLKVGNKGLSDCLHTVVPELLMPAETIQYLCKAKECLSPEEFLKIYNNPLQPKMDSECVWPTPTHMIS
ncbi:testis-expressed protein 47-like [Podarcis raffonei]|uniref:testis-expressed protein 47-like n=1 Tax=Podarcis raffonei TaxID=65483 RepID=UPI00232954D2|nr:testis-expressed protein 47-like [Podarcis raffonei]